MEESSLLLEGSACAWASLRVTLEASVDVAELVEAFLRAEGGAVDGFSRLALKALV